MIKIHLFVYINATMYFEFIDSVKQKYLFSNRKNVFPSVPIESVK